MNDLVRAGNLPRQRFFEAIAIGVDQGGVLWMCEGADCFAAKGTARPAVMCKRLAEAASPVTSFTFGGEALDADDLAACNR